MSIDEKTLLEERKVLEEDFNTTKDRIVQVEKDLNNMKNNINNLFQELIQQIDKLLVLVREVVKKKKMVLPEKENKSLKKWLVSMKRFKEFSKDEDIKDFEEDVMGEDKQLDDETFEEELIY